MLPFQKSKDMIGNKGRKKKQFVVCSFSGLLAAGLTSQFLSQTSMKKIKKIKKNPYAYIHNLHARHLCPGNMMLQVPFTVSSCFYF